MYVICPVSLHSALQGFMWCYAVLSRAKDFLPHTYMQKQGCQGRSQVS